MIYSRYSTPFYQKKVDASLSFPNHEQSRSIEKGRDTKKKKKKRLILQTSYQGQRRPPFPCPREFNRGWNVGRGPAPLPSPPLSPSTRSSPISDVDCSDDVRGGKDPGFRKGNRGQSSLPCSSNDGHTILINRFFLPPPCGRFNSSLRLLENLSRSLCPLRTYRTILYNYFMYIRKFISRGWRFKNYSKNDQINGNRW